MWFSARPGLIKNSSRRSKNDDGILLCFPISSHDGPMPKDLDITGKTTHRMDPHRYPRFSLSTDGYPAHFWAYHWALADQPLCQSQHSTDSPPIFLGSEKCISDESSGHESHSNMPGFFNFCGCRTLSDGSGCRRIRSLSCRLAFFLAFCYSSWRHSNAAFP